jgi:hypothetical protein
MWKVEIRIQECIDERWSEWFEGFEITYTSEGVTVLIGSVADQAALYGVIAKLRDLGLPLQSVNRLETETPTAGDGARKAHGPRTNHH